MNIKSLHPSGQYLYAVSRTGSLYKISGSTAEILINSNNGDDEVRHIAGAADRVLILYRSGGVRRLRLFTTANVLKTDLTAGSCSEFVYTKSRPRCQQLIPDPNTGNAVAVSPSRLRDITLPFIDRLQYGGSGNYTILWYRDNGPRALLIGDAQASTSDRNDMAASGGTFVQTGNTGNENAFICSDNNSICAISDSRDTSISSVAMPISESITDLAVVASRIVGISNEGRLVYVDSAFSGTPVAVTVYEQGSTTVTPRVLCEAIVQSRGSRSQQVSFSHMSEGAPSSRDMRALIGGVTAQGGDAKRELYLLAPRAANRVAYWDTDTLCSADNVERYHLPASSFSLRLNES